MGVVGNEVRASAEVAIRASPAVMGFAGDAVAVAVHLGAIAGLTGEERRLAGGADFVAAGKMDQPVRCGARGWPRR